MAGRGLFTRDFIAKNQWIWICEYAGELQHASSFPGGFPQSAKGNTHTRGVEPMFSRLQVKNLTPQNANGKLASFANDKRDSKTNSAAFQRKHVTTKRTRKQVWLKATKPINAGAEIFVTYSRDYWKRQDEEDVGVEVSPPPHQKKGRPLPHPPFLRITITCRDQESRILPPLHLIYLYVYAVLHTLTSTTLRSSFGRRSLHRGEYVGQNCRADL